MKRIVCLAIIFCFALLPGCATDKMRATMPQVAQVVTTGQSLAHQLDNVYEFLVTQKAVPDNREAATRALAALDDIAQDVQAGAAALSGDKFNSAQFIINSAILAARIMGYVVPLVL
jgi:hypothetical protein